MQNYSHQGPDTITAVPGNTSLHSGLMCAAASDMRSHDPVSTDRNVGALPDCTAVWASILFQELQTCTPMVVFLGFETPLRDPRGLYKGYMKAILGKPFRVTTLGIQPWDR